MATKDSQKLRIENKCENKPNYARVFENLHNLPSPKEIVKLLADATEERNVSTDGTKCGINEIGGNWLAGKLQRSFQLMFLIKGKRSHC